MKYEKPQKCNPNRIVINQHIFPKRSIQRFADTSGRVDVYLISNSKRVRLKTSDKIFCTRRTWDQKSELGYMKRIEDSFQILACKILKHNNYELNETENRQITEFLDLWTLKFDYHIRKRKDVQLKGIHPGNQPFTKNEEEILEQKGVVFVRDVNSLATIPSHIMNGLRIMTSLDGRQQSNADTRWGVIKSQKGEFIVPDTFADYAIVPLTPRILLLGFSKNLLIPITEVAKINHLAILLSKKYYFAKNFNLCPLLKG